MLRHQIALPRYLAVGSLPSPAFTGTGNVALSISFSKYPIAGSVHDCALIVPPTTPTVLTTRRSAWSGRSARLSAPASKTVDFGRRWIVSQKVALGRVFVVSKSIPIIRSRKIWLPMSFERTRQGRLVAKPSCGTPLKMGGFHGPRRPAPFCPDLFWDAVRARHGVAENVRAYAPPLPMPKGKSAYRKSQPVSERSGIHPLPPSDGRREASASEVTVGRLDDESGRREDLHAAKQLLPLSTEPRRHAITR